MLIIAVDLLTTETDWVQVHGVYSPVLQVCVSGNISNHLILYKMYIYSLPSPWLMGSAWFLEQTVINCLNSTDQFICAMGSQRVRWGRRLISKCYLGVFHPPKEWREFDVLKSGLCSTYVTNFRCEEFLIVTQSTFVQWSLSWFVVRELPASNLGYVAVYLGLSIVWAVSSVFKTSWQ